MSHIDCDDLQIIVGNKYIIMIKYIFLDLITKIIFSLDIVQFTCDNLLMLFKSIVFSLILINVRTFRLKIFLKKCFLCLEIFPTFLCCFLGTQV